MAYSDQCVCFDPDGALGSCPKVSMPSACAFAFCVTHWSPSHQWVLYFVSGEGVIPHGSHSLAHHHLTVDAAASDMAAIMMSLIGPILQCTTHMPACLYHLFALPFVGTFDGLGWLPCALLDVSGEGVNPNHCCSEINAKTSDMTNIEMSLSAHHLQTTDMTPAVYSSHRMPCCKFQQLKQNDIHDAQCSLLVKPDAPWMTPTCIPGSR